MRQRAQEMEDPALQCLVAGARLVGVNINAKQLRHSYVFSNAAMDEIAVVRAARELGLRRYTFLCRGKAAAHDTVSGDRSPAGREFDPSVGARRQSAAMLDSPTQ